MVRTLDINRFIHLLTTLKMLSVMYDLLYRLFFFFSVFPFCFQTRPAEQTLFSKFMRIYSGLYKKHTAGSL